MNKVWPLNSRPERLPQEQSRRWPSVAGGQISLVAEDHPTCPGLTSRTGRTTDQPALASRWMRRRTG